MPVRCVLISGQIAVGKSSVARQLADRTNARTVRVRDALAQVLNIAPDDRARLQTEGADLDVRTGGRWLIDFLLEQMDESDLVVDSMRTIRQTDQVLKSVDAVLVYLDAPQATRLARFETAIRQGDAVKQSMNFWDAMRHETETDVVSLRGRAQIVVETDGMSCDDVVDEIVAGLGS